MINTYSSLYFAGVIKFRLSVQVAVKFGQKRVFICGVGGLIDQGINFGHSLCG